MEGVVVISTTPSTFLPITPGHFGYWDKIMVFSSVIFLFGFLPIVLLAYFCVPKKFRNFLLLLFSLCFYGWGEGLLVLMVLFSVFVNYLLAIVMNHFNGKAADNTEGSLPKRILLGSSG